MITSDKNMYILKKNKEINWNILMNPSHAYHHLNGMFIMDHIKLDLIVIYIPVYMYICICIWMRGLYTSNYMNTWTFDVIKYNKIV